MNEMNEENVNENVKAEVPLRKSRSTYVAELTNVEFPEIEVIKNVIPKIGKVPVTIETRGSKLTIYFPKVENDELIIPAKGITTSLWESKGRLFLTIPKEVSENIKDANSIILKREKEYLFVGEPMTTIKIPQKR